MNLGARIRQARRETQVNGRPMTQRELARRIGASERSVKRWETGPDEPKPAAMRGIMRATNRPHAFFYPDDEDEEAALAVALEQVSADIASRVRALLDQARQVPA